MLKPVPLLMVITCLSSFANLAQADSTITFSTSKIPEPSTVMIKNGKIRMETVNSGGKNVSIYDNATETFIMLNSFKKEYIPMNDESISRQAEGVKAMKQQMMAQIQERMKSMSPEQRKQMEEQIAEFTGDSTGAPPALPKFSTKKTGKKEKVNKIECETYNTFKDNEQVGEACIADYSAVGLSDKDSKTLKALFKFIRNMSSRFAEAAGKAAPENPMSIFDQLNGFPIKVSDASGSVMTLKSANNEPLSDDLFEVPKGYTKVEMPNPAGDGNPKPAR